MLNMSGDKKVRTSVRRSGLLGIKKKEDMHRTSLSGCVQS